MRNALQLVVFWFFRNFLSFLVIVAILMAAVFLQREITAWNSLTNDLPKLENEQRLLDGGLSSAKAKLATRVTQFRSASDNVLAERISIIEKEIEGKRLEQQRLGGLTSILRESSIEGGIAKRVKIDLEINLLMQEKEHLNAIRSGLNAIRSGSNNLENQQIELGKKRALLVQIVDEHNSLLLDNKILVRVPLSPQRKKLEELQDTHKKENAKYESGLRQHEQQKILVGRLRAAKNSFQVQEEQLNQILSPLKDTISKQKNEIQESWITKFSQPAIKIIPTALLILLAIILTPIAIKALFYFVLAPLASRLPAICIIPGASGTVFTNHDGSNHSADPSRFTAVSLRLAMAESEELLIHPEYLQSSPVDAHIDTKWLLDWSLPLSSLASGMVALSRIRCDTSSTIVISPIMDPFSEVGFLTMPNSSAIVFQPRSLIGVVYRKDQPLRITQHWRLTSLHAWLTLQLRYLVFHGPSKLIVKGCRGARVEEANIGRKINQAATMGFSANLLYSTTRCDTFMSYLSGEQELFHDRFSGTPGVYVYEEMPHFGQKKGLTGRGVEGVVDSLLKVFGL